MATLTPVHPSITGTTVPYAAASAGGDTVVAGSSTYLLVRNGGGSSVTVTLVTPGTEFNGQPIPDTAITVAAGAESIIPVTNSYRSSFGNAAITYSAVTSVTVAALSIG